MKFDAVKNTLIREADQAGLDQYEIFFKEASGVSAETLKDEIASFSSASGGGICFRCVVDGHMGSASTELFTEEEMKALVLRAAANAREIENDDVAEIFGGSPSYATPNIPPYVAPSAAEIKQIALDLQKKTYEQSEYVMEGTQTSVFTEFSHVELVNSCGLQLSNSVGVSGAYVSVAVKKDEEASDAFNFAEGLTAESLSPLPAKTVKEALDKLAADSVESGKYDIIFSGKEMRSLLSTFSSVFSAKNAQLGLSLLKDREGEQIAAPCVTLIDDPMREGCPLQTPFDGEGVATYRKNVVENGTLKTLLYDLATAKRAGVSSTANGQRSNYSDPVTIRPYNFYLVPGNMSRDELFTSLKDGLYITALNGLHAGANDVTGDFSLDSEGFLVKDGKIVKAVKSFTVAGNFFELLKKVEAIADNLDFGFPSGYTVYGSPDVLVRDMSVAGK